MKILKDDLDWAVSEGILSKEQAEKLWSALESKYANRPKFDVAHIAYYFGGMVAISAMFWFMNETWKQYGGFGIFVISVVYAVCFVLAGRTLWYKQGLKIPGGILITLAVFMIPVAIYGLEQFTGLWPKDIGDNYFGYLMKIRKNWVLIELGTIVAGLVALKYIRFPFLTAPIAIALYKMSLDIISLFISGVEYMPTEIQMNISIWFGLIIILVAYLIDRRTNEDYSFWLYLFGMLAFWIGLSYIAFSQWDDSHLKMFIYCLINIIVMIISLVLQRPLFIVFGVIGIFSYIIYLAHRAFENSLIFPFILTIIGIAIIYFGIKYQQNRNVWEQAILRLIPSKIKRLLPTERIRLKNK